MSRRQMDGIVERFIQYDIGRLEGSAGVKAKREFDQLGPDAIPALVDGLNRSAGYQQSCPVGVISAKLERALQDTDDPAMIQYALDNIGRGVPENAPHANRIRGLRRRWAGQVVRNREVIRSDLQQRGLPADDGIVDRVRLLMNASQSDVEEALRDPDPRVRLAAVTAIRIRSSLAGPDGDVIAARLLGEALNDDHPVVQGIARDHLIQLAGGADLGRDPDMWQEYWDVVERTRQIAGPLPRDLVEQLDHPEGAIRQAVVKAVAAQANWLSATQRAELGQRLSGLLLDGQPEVRQAAEDSLMALAGGDQLSIVGPGDRSYRDNPAKRWREYWQRYELELATQPRAESLFAMARTLEERGRVEEAVERYRRIIIEYRDTTAATRARARLDALD
jgi:hypothetical protein